MLSRCEGRSNARAREPRPKANLRLAAQEVCLVHNLFLLFMSRKGANLIRLLPLFVFHDSQVPIPLIDRYRERVLSAFHNDP